MIFLFLNLFYEHDKTINQHFQIQNHFLLSILSLRFGNYLRFIYYLSSLIMSPVSLPDLISSLSLCTSFSCIFRRNKIYMHIHLNFLFVRFISNSLMIIYYITYGIILQRYCFTVFCLYLPCFHNIYYF